MQRMIKNSVWWRHRLTDKEKLSVTDTNYLWQRHTVYYKKKQTALDRHTLSVTDTYCMWQTYMFSDKFSVTDEYVIWEIFWDKQQLSVLDIDCLWQKQTVCDSHTFSVTHTDCLWKTQTVFDRHRLSVTETYCLWQTQNVCDRLRRFVTEKILNMEWRVNTWFVLGIPRAKQIGLKHGKNNLEGCDHQQAHPPPFPRMTTIKYSTDFLDGFPY